MKVRDLKHHLKDLEDDVEFMVVDQKQRVDIFSRLKIAGTGLDMDETIFRLYVSTEDQTLSESELSEIIRIRKMKSEEKESK